jgi:hypothetical protein
MKKSYIVTNLLLLGSAAFLAYDFRSQWKEYQSAHNLGRLTPVKSSAEAGHKILSGSGKVPSYAAIVDDDLFSADRTNIVPPEAPAETAKAISAKPILVGTMQLDDNQFALMVSDTQRENTNYKQLKVGDVLDGYTLVKILDQKVMMKADGKEVEVRLSVNEPSKMVAREASAGTSASVGQVTSVSSAPSTPVSGSGTVTDQQLPKGTIPVGTIVNGRRKKLVPSPFGMMETWEEVK